MPSPDFSKSGLLVRQPDSLSATQRAWDQLERFSRDSGRQLRLFLVTTAVLVGLTWWLAQSLAPSLSLTGVSPTSLLAAVNIWAGGSLLALALLLSLDWLYLFRQPGGGQSARYTQWLPWVVAMTVAIILIYGFYALGTHKALLSPYTGMPWPVVLYLNLIVLVHTVGLVCLTGRFRDLSTLVILTALPVLLLQARHAGQLINWSSVLLLNFYLVFIWLCGQQISLLRKRLLEYAVRNDKLLGELAASTDSNEQALGYLSQALADKLVASQALEGANISLEAKVQERTQELDDRNSDLQVWRERLEMANEVAGIASWDWHVQQRQIYFSNLEHLLGYSAEQFNAYMGNMRAIIHPDDYAQASHQTISHLRGKTDYYMAEYRMRTVSQAWVMVKDIGKVIERDQRGRPVRMVGVCRILEDDRMVSSQFRLVNMVFQHAQEGFFILDNQLNFVEANPCLCRLLGTSREQLLGRQLFAEHDEVPTVRRQQFQILDALKTTHEYQGEMLHHNPNGVLSHLFISVHPVMEQGRVQHYVGMVNDLTRQKIADEQLAYLSSYDQLTDLPNRDMFKTFLMQQTKRPEQSAFALVRLNVDRFRLLNESLGTEAGDSLLRYLAVKLKEFRTRDGGETFLARLGNDDFAIVLRNEFAHRAAVEGYAQRLLALFEQPIPLHDRRLVITISLGIALYPDHGQTVEQLTQHAEKALQQIKRVGGNGMRFYSHEGGMQSLERIQLESALRQALAQDELVIYYQPKLHAITGVLDGFEALVRWQHPRLGLISPAQFIPVAEETGLLSALGQIVLEKSCAQLVQWQQMGLNASQVAVNVGVQQLQRGSFLDTLRGVLSRHTLPTASLQLEITESSLMDDPERINALLKSVRGLGISIALDDFGTGFSSLSYLGHYPIDVIKVDRAFTQQLGTPSQDAIVRAIIAMGHSLGMVVVAEGVETPVQAQFLINEGCDVLQGYLIGKPLTAEQATHFLQNLDPVLQPAPVIA